MFWENISAAHFKGIPVHSIDPLRLMARDGGKGRVVLAVIVR